MTMLLTIGVIPPNNFQCRGCFHTKYRSALILDIQRIVEIYLFEDYGSLTIETATLLCSTMVHKKVPQH